MNRRMNLPAVAKIMREFEKQNERMEMTSEMMGDAGAWRCSCWGSLLLLAWSICAASVGAPAPPHAAAGLYGGPMLALPTHFGAAVLH